MEIPFVKVYKNTLISYINTGFMSRVLDKLK